jgi:hypothetical protein
MIPFIGMTLISLLFWILDLQTMNYISRGCSSILYHVIALFAICSAVYLFGGDAIEYTLYAMILANLGIVLYSIKCYGISAFLSGLVIFIKSGGIDTTPPIKALEVHDLTFAFGIYMMYYLMVDTGKKRWLYMAGATICYLLGFKRIAAIGICGVVVLHLVLGRLSEKGQERMIRLLSVAAIVVCFFYVYMIRSTLFDTIVDYFEIDTMGRQGLYAAFRSVYDFKPTFRGYGIGYVTRYISIMTEQKVGVFGKHEFGGMHNDIVTLYIELGFVGFSLWIWYEWRCRILWIMKKFGLKAVKPLLYGTIYTFVTYATDNTVFYCYINTIFMLIPLAYTVKLMEAKVDTQNELTI